MTSLVWFRQDLRCADNPAWSAAISAGPAIPVYILDDSTPAVRRIGAAGRWWLHHSLSTLNETLDGDLVLRRGDAMTALKTLIAETSATSIFWNRLYEPGAVARDKKIKTALATVGVATASFNGSLLHEPWDVKTGSGAHYKVFTPYWRAASRLSIVAPLPAPTRMPHKRKPPSESLVDWRLTPREPDWAKLWKELWSPGERGATKRLAMFLENGINGYAVNRDRPDLHQVSRLSPHLHWGEISPRQICAALARAMDTGETPIADGEAFLRELYWREFSYYLLYHFPDLPKRNWRREFDAFQWRDDERALDAWRRGRTGYPLVDAGMRELWGTGYMHNRVRMAAASFLVKHLRVHWREGESWFWDTLVDADLASNSANWQWVAGTGADAAPYFRIFNPVTQGRKFDPEGAYIRRWVPELAQVADRYIHAPFAAPEEALRSVGVRLGETYPRPIVNLGCARAEALAAYKAARSGMR